MNGLRKILCLLTALGFAAFALPGIGAGPQKQYSLNMSPSAVLASGPFVVTAKFQNQTPSGNSTFNSLELILPAGSGLVIDQSITPTIKYATTANGTLQTASGTPTIITDGTGSTQQKIRISNINPPIKPNWVFVVTFTVIPTGTCTNINATWSANVWTGSNFSGDTFLLLTGLSSLTMGGCDVVLSECAPPNNVYNESSLGGNNTSIERLPNKDGSACQAIAFNVTFSDQDRTVQIKWDELTFQNVVLRATVTWPLELTETSTSFPRRTRVAWEEIPVGTPNFIPAPACTSDEPPGPTPVPHTPMPTMTTGPYAGVRVRACLIEENFRVKLPTFTGCPTPTSAAVGCVLVDSEFFITGDPWLSRQ